MDEIIVKVLKPYIEFVYASLWSSCTMYDWHFCSLSDIHFVPNCMECLLLNPVSTWYVGGLYLNGILMKSLKQWKVSMILILDFNSARIFRQYFNLKQQNLNNDFSKALNSDDKIPGYDCQWQTILDPPYIQFRLHLKFVHAYLFKSKKLYFKSAS